MAVQSMSSEGSRLIASIVIPFVLATIAFTLRIISRTASGRVGADDWCVIFAYAIYFGLFITCILSATSGSLGWAQSELNTRQAETYLKFAYAIEILYAIVSPSVKLSFVLLYSRILDETRALRIGLLATVTAILAWFLATFFATIFQCSPASAYWIPDHKNSCIDQRALQVGTSSINVVLNAVIVLMPLPIVYNTPIMPGEKIVVFVMLGLGSLITIFSVLRAYYLAQIDPLNMSGTAANAAIWTSVEPGIVIFCCSLPAILSMVLSYRAASRARQFSPTSSKSDTAETAHRRSDDSKLLNPRNYEKVQGAVPSTEYVRDMELAMPKAPQSRFSSFFIPDDRIREVHHHRSQGNYTRVQKEFTIYSAFGK